MTEMASVDHSNPHTGETFVASFKRGVVIADGGERGAGPEDDSDGGEEERADGDAGVMADVAHESETDGPTRSFERGTEGRDRTV